MSDDISDDILAQVSDYLDGVLPPDARTDVAAKIESDPLWKRAHAEMLETREAMSGLQKARVAPAFDQDVTDIIRRRSAGAFFARRTFGDRVPFGVLMVIALIALAAIAYVLHGSSTGSLKGERPAADPPPAQPLLPKP